MISTFFLMHHILKPVSRPTIKHNNKRIFKKWTILDSQNSFVVVGETLESAEYQITLKKSINLPIQPFLVIIGDLNSPKEILVYFDDIRYRFFNVLKAIDCCFEIFFVFNLTFPETSQVFWQFLQQYFYDVKTEHDGEFPSIYSIMKLLESDL